MYSKEGFTANCSEICSIGSVIVCYGISIFFNDDPLVYFFVVTRGVVILVVECTSGSPIRLISSESLWISNLVPVSDSLFLDDFLIPFLIVSVPFLSSKVLCFYVSLKLFVIEFNLVLLLGDEFLKAPFDRSDSYLWIDKLCYLTLKFSKF